MKNVRTYFLKVMLLALALLLSPVLAQNNGRVVHFHNIYFQSHNEITDTVKEGEPVIMYIYVSNDSSDTKAFRVEHYFLYPDGVRSETVSTNGTVAGKHFWIQSYALAFNGKGTVKVYCKLYSVMGDLVDEETRTLNVKEAE
jgi:hypothetical protein